MNRYHYFSQKTLNEEYWINEAKKDIDKFAFLYDRYYVPIFRFVLQRCEDENNAADITSQVFLKAMLNIKSFQYRGVPFSCWLIRIAKNEINMNYRINSRKRHINIPSENLPDIFVEQADNQLEENIDLLKKAMNKLKVNEIELIEMFYFENMPVKEIAEINDLTETNVKVRLHRIRNKLEKIIKKIQPNEQVQIFS